MTTSLFPSQVDTFTTMTDISNSDSTNVSTYQSLLQQSTLSPSQQTQLASLTQTLQSQGKILSSDYLNHLSDAIAQTQSYFLNTVNSDITNMENTFSAKVAKFSNQGAYNPATTYMNMNFVTWNGQSYICTVDNTLNIDPSHTSNWTLIAAQGATGPAGLNGAPGTGLNFQGAYDSTKVYQVNMAVQYNGSLYACIQQTTAGISPSNGSYWSLAIASGTSFTLTSLTNRVTLTTAASNVSIGISQYNSSQDLLLVYSNSTFIQQNIDWKLDADLISIDKYDGTTWNNGTAFDFVVFKNMQNSLIYTDGTMLQNGTLHLSAFANDVDTMLWMGF